MSVEQSIQLGENVPTISRPAWFLDLRLNPALLTSEGAQPISATEEQLLLVMHGAAKRLMVVSNKSLTIYKLPGEAYKLVEPKTIIGKILIWVVFAIKTVIIFAGLGEVLELFEKVWELLEWLWHKISGKAKREYEEALQLILDQKDTFLMTSLHQWKAKARFTASIQNPVTITVEPYGVRILVGRKKEWMAYRDHSWGPINLVKDLIESNRQALEAAGWSVATTSQGFIFKNSK
jgi:hypothetical protein